jgi:4-diphosphocytidyl-2-C-methyl-D-erythritol kinase
MGSVEQWFSPAKINFYLAVTGSRSDGFHSIESIVSTLDFGDTITVSFEDGEDRFDCNHSEIGWNSSNLIYQALELYRSKTGFDPTFHIDLKKQIPLGSGLGGGSSNASTFLKAVDALNPDPVGWEKLKIWSQELGSDCPLFFGQGFSRVSGRGEYVEPFDCLFSDHANEWKLLLVHPGFGISAGWAYTRLKSMDEPYTKASCVEEEMRIWRTEEQPWQTAHRNDLSLSVDRKFLPIPTLKSTFFEVFEVPLMMSGSGSTCYAILGVEEDVSPYVAFLKKAWGENAFIRVCRFGSV